MNNYPITFQFLYPLNNAIQSNVFMPRNSFSLTIIKYIFFMTSIMLYNLHTRYYLLFIIYQMYLNFPVLYINILI